MAASIDTTHKRLYVSGIPTDQNNFQQLSEHFKQFGTISKIIISYHGKPDSALVTFASHNEANLAMNSPQAVFGNAGIQVRWGIRSKQTSTSQQTSLSSPLSSSSSSSSPSNTSKTTFQCEKCTKILATKRTLQNHMRQMHGEFRCQVCSTVFESGNEYLRHYNSMHSDSKDFARHFGDSNGSVRNNANMNFHPEHVMETLRRENCSLIKKVKKHKKNKSKMDKKLQERLVKLLEGELNTVNSIFSVRMSLICALNFCFLQKKLSDKLSWRPYGKKTTISHKNWMKKRRQSWLKWQHARQ